MGVDNHTFTKGPTSLQKLHRTPGHRLIRFSVPQALVLDTQAAGCLKLFILHTP